MLPEQFFQPLAGLCELFEQRRDRRCRPAEFTSQLIGKGQLRVDRHPGPIRQHLESRVGGEARLPAQAAKQLFDQERRVQPVVLADRDGEEDQPFAVLGQQGGGHPPGQAVAGNRDVETGGRHYPVTGRSASLITAVQADRR